MPPSYLLPLLTQIKQLSKRLPSQSGNAHNTKPPIKKRHWLLGSLIILVGSWITHTTTATIEEISDELVTEAGFAAPVSQDVSLVQEERSSRNQTPASSFMAALKPMSLATPALPVTSAPTPAETVALTTIEHTIKKGQSLGVIFRKQGFNLAIPDKVSKHPIARQLVAISIGKTLQFGVDQAGTLQQIRYPINALQELIVELDGTNVADAKIDDLPFQTVEQSVSAEITSSLYETALETGLSNNTIMEMIRVFGWDIDFVQDIRVGDTFHIIHTDYHINGEKVADGNILAAEFTTQGQRYRAVRFEDDEGNISFYTPEGESMLGTFLRSPVEFSRISSRFGKRKHPISKKWKAHKGVDYAASRGTPIRATADGKVVHAGRKGGYGNTIVLRHAGRFTTLYAHMNGFAKGVRSGSRVKQGQTIGYVGSTGYSTGPHLHYEFRVDGVHRNSLTYKTPKSSSVKESMKPEFDALAANLVSRLDAVQKNYMLAKSETDTKKI